MKTLTPLQRATIQMSVGIAVLTAVTEVVYVILAIAVPTLTYAWKFTVGNVFMAAIMALNFYLMARGVYQAVDTGDQDYAKRQIHLNHTVRTIIFVLALVSCFLFGYGLDGTFHYEPGIAACITVAYPQLTVFLLRLTGKFGTGEETAAVGDAPTETAPAKGALTGTEAAPEVPAGNEAASDAPAGTAAAQDATTTAAPAGGTPTGEGDAATSGAAADGGDRPLPPTDAGGEDA